MQRYYDYYNDVTPFPSGVTSYYGEDIIDSRYIVQYNYLNEEAATYLYPDFKRHYMGIKGTPRYWYAEILGVFII